MPLTFSKVHVDFDTLLCHLGKTAEEANAKIDAFLLENPNINRRKFHFELSVKQGGIEHITYVVYAVVPTGTTVTKPLQIVTLKRNTFLCCELSKQEYDNLFKTDVFQNELSAYLKAHLIKPDYSSVFVLLEEKGDRIVAYIPYKE